MHIKGFGKTEHLERGNSRASTPFVDSYFVHLSQSSQSVVKLMIDQIFMKQL
jgi:hypothetical protein